MKFAVQFGALLLAVAASSTLVCDFDVVQKEPKLLVHLSNSCQQVYRNQPALVELMIDESRAFSSFLDALHRLEAARDPVATVQQIPGQMLPDVRQQLYEQLAAVGCDGRTTHAEQLGCLTEQRKKMELQILAMM